MVQEKTLRRSAIPLLATSFALLIGGPNRVFPQNEASRPAPSVTSVVALVVPRPLGGAQDVPYLRILAAALEIELVRAGFVVRVPDALEIDDLAGASLERLLAEARTVEADFLLIEGYTSVGQTLRVEIEVRRVEDGERIASAEASRRIDLRLDEVVGDAVDKLLPRIEPQVAAALKRRQAALDAQPPVAVAIVEQAPEVLEESGTVESEPQPTEPAVEQEPSATPGPAAERPRRLAIELAAGGAPFFPMAKMTDLFTLGYLTTVYLDYRVNLPMASLAFGGYAGYAALLPVSQGTATYFRSLVPIGVEMRFGTPDGWPLGLYLRLLAGTAINVSPQVRVGERLTRVLPQVKAGAGLSVAFSRRTGLAVEFLYELLLYLYMDAGSLAVEPVMGFDVPSVYFYTRW